MLLLLLIQGLTSFSIKSSFSTISSINSLSSTGTIIWYLFTSQTAVNSNCII
ncbi:hypothetical protein A0H76_3017 [Hepatospora eriocheir]|uniref:Uncharacterized protein n=1 Tax=Hepatospora eriocheir TaxID=1081669 RepID=A0A1X0QIV9_9MICR|nr:hypothetical protein A0H76_3017 [Hepatospora eriocheir]